jgi:hypothetical protein
MYRYKRVEHLKKAKLKRLGRLIPVKLYKKYIEISLKKKDGSKSKD